MEFGDEHAHAYVFNGHKSAQADAQNKCCFIDNADTVPAHPTATGQCESMHRTSTKKRSSTGPMLLDPVCHPVSMLPYSVATDAHRGTILQMIDHVSE